MSEAQHIARLAEKLSEHGFVLVQRFCRDEFVAQLLEVSRRRSRELLQVLGERRIGIGSAAGYEEIVQRSPGRWDVPIAGAEFGIDDKDLPWLPLVQHILGSDAEASFSGVVWSEPGTPAQYWHTDSPHTDSRHRPPHALNVMLALHDIPLEMGPTEVARGSHRLSNHLCNPQLVCEQLIYQHPGTTPDILVAGTDEAVPQGVATALAPGSCLVFDDRLLHRGLANRSDSPRYMAYFSYRRKGYDANTHFESRRSLFDPEAGPDC